MKANILKVVFGVMLIPFFVLAPIMAEASYIKEQEPNDTAASAQSLDAYFSYGTNSTIELDAAGTLASYSASVYGFSGDSTYDYYSFTVGTGGTDLALNVPVAFDIDFAYINSLDTILVLFDTDGTSLLKYNDDDPVDGPGDIKANTLNSFLTYTFTTAGTYYIRVSQFSASQVYGDVLSTDATYHLHVSTVPLPPSLLLMMSGLLGCVPFFASSKRQRR